MSLLSRSAPAVRLLRASPGWLTLIALAAVAAVNLAGFWGIRVAQQGARDEARRGFQLDVAARASRVERRLSEVRSDLAFLAGSPTIARLGDAGHDASSLRRQAAESALLIFLRSHPEVVRISIAATGDGRPLVHVGRRGGVPVLWVSASPTGEEGAAVDPRRPRLIARLPQPTAEPEPAGGVALEVEVAAGALLDPGDAQPSGALPACELDDAAGARLGRFPPGARFGSEPAEASGAAVQADGWAAAGPLRLACWRATAAALGFDAPILARYRTTFALNLAVMALALLLGGFAVQQARSRAGLEARAAEEAHVRELERRLFHAERLSTVGRLAAGIAHELNNPLEGMSNYLALARDASARGDAEATSRHLAAVRQGLERAAGIVHQVLAHADPAKAPMTPVDLNRVLRETGDFVRSRSEFAQVEISFALGAEPLVVRGSPVMLGQVAMNLIVNGCEAQPAGGEVRVVSRREAGHVIVEFQDRGSGVPEADRERIFEPFFSNKSSTGLGLSICHTIVAQHAGELSVEPRAGGGSLFRLRLPAWEGGA